MNSTTRPTCVIADDHCMFRQAIRSLLEDEGFDVVGEATNGHEAVKLVTQEKPQLALLDYGMPILNGSFAAAEILKRSPETQVVLLTMYDDETFALDAVKSGVRGYVLKEQAAQELVAALRQVLSGSIYLSPGISESVVTALLSKKEQPADLLTAREKQVLQLIAEGKTTKDIANLLHLSVKTAESHRSNIMNRLDVHNVASLVRYAIRRGMIEA
ncbi:MAG: response regulator transcription factor [Xanthomonadales bacterium]|jgi:DNA-binding NarL/FixJ family response regulator|nr:response regulator transcription factor [Xanthomonadales bacterium]